MKTLFNLAFLLLFALQANSQSLNPFESIGKKGKIITLSNGKYIEVYSNDSLQKIGSVIMNMNTGRVYKYLEIDTVYSEATLEPTIISRWYSVDPKGGAMSGWSPYNYAVNNPISVNDPDGQYPIYFMIRRYESSGYFGTPFLSKGDNRQTSANVNSSARIHHYIGIETNTPKFNNPVFYNYAKSSNSQQYLPWPGSGVAKPTSSASGDVLTNNDRVFAGNFEFKNSGMEPIASKFCESCTPAIDTKGFIGVNEFKDKGELQIFGSVNGDNFPDAEGFIYDKSGNGISLGDYQHSMFGSPMKDLWGEGNDKLLNFDISVKVDKDGNFQSASFMKDGKSVPLKVYNQKETNFDSSNLPK
ncbi:MAG: hypothetical protein MH472_09370 [Bacteroidia bacterium]|nr:hypothetical protein [Bacteroidia bacterium]